MRIKKYRNYFLKPKEVKLDPENSMYHSILVKTYGTKKALELLKQSLCEPHFTMAFINKVKSYRPHDSIPSQYKSR